MATKFVLKQSFSKTNTTENPVIGEYFFDGSIFTIGSDAANNLILTEAAPEQLVVMREDGRLTLINSHEGTALNNAALKREAIETLADGDDIQIGTYIISVVDGERSAANGNSVNKFLSTDKFPSTDKNLNDALPRNDAPLLPVAADSSKDETAESKNPRNFAEVLNTLRTEEDSFYFIRQSANGDETHAALEDAETPIGETAGGDIVFNIEQISTVFAVARKDWSGILLESQRRGAVFVNGEPVETTRRLRNDDLVSFAGRTKFSLRLHEPSSLVALESLLSARVVDSNNVRFGGLAAKTSDAATENQAASTPPKQSISPLERKYFNYFSLLEVVMMIIATLIGAVLVFLLFEIVLS